MADDALAAEPAAADEPVAPAELVLRFLTSIGRPAEARQYLDLFRSEHPERFALVHVAGDVVRDAADALALELRYLVALGLRPVLVFGAVEPAAAADAARRVATALSPTTPTRAVDGTAPDEVRTVIRAGAVPLCVLDRPDRDDGGADVRFDAVADLAVALDTRKVVFVTRESGLQPTGGAVVSLIDLGLDADRRAADALPAEQRDLLRQIGRILARVPRRVTVSITSPLDLLRELFTVKGAGTLVRRGSVVTRHLAWDGVDRPRVRALIEASFARPLVAGFEERAVLAVYVADDYRGVAVVTPAPLAPYLSKFAVDTVSRGEGVGRDLWDRVAADFPRLLWRTRAANPITPWYRDHCDGMVRLDLAGEAWWAMWRGLAPLEIPTAIDHCRAAPLDL